MAALPRVSAVHIEGCDYCGTTSDCLEWWCSDVDVSGRLVGSVGRLRREGVVKVFCGCWKGGEGWGNCGSEMRFVFEWMGLVCSFKGVDGGRSFQE